MNTSELIFGSWLIVVLIAAGSFFGLRQLKGLRALNANPELGGAERMHLRRQLQRRLFCSVLMLLFAGMLIGSFFLPQPVDGRALHSPDPDPDAEAMVRLAAWYWIVALLVLFVLLALASLDLIATARYGVRQVRQLESQRRAELNEELARFRREQAERN